jgi:hypothetical protein
MSGVLSSILRSQPQSGDSQYTMAAVTRPCHPPCSLAPLVTAMVGKLVP